MSPYSPGQSLAPFIGDSSNQCQKQHHNSELGSHIRCEYFCRARIILSAFKCADFEGKATIPVFQGASRDVTIGEGRETALASSTTFVFPVGNTNIRGMKFKIHVIETDSSRVVTILSGLCKEHVHYLDLMGSGLDILFTSAVVHYDNKPL